MRTSPRYRKPRRNDESDKRYFLKTLPKWLHGNSEVDESTPKLNGKHCRLLAWQNRDGYLALPVKLRGRQRYINAHVVAYYGDAGKVPPEKWGAILHGCDTPRCVEPRHLKPGSHAKNMAQKVEKRRFAKDFKTPEDLAIAEAMRLFKWQNTETPVPVLVDKFGWKKTPRMAGFALTGEDAQGTRMYQELDARVPPFPKRNAPDYHTRIFLWNFRECLSNAIATNSN